jgi:8-oxo-dGTP pyrophosphatase MutT (NUDIX family)
LRTVNLPGVELRESAVLVPLFFRGSEPHALFTRRPMTLRHHAGQISFPGGGRDAHDESLLHTALREAHEEVGIVAREVLVLGRLDELPTPTYFRISPFVGAVSGEGRWRSSSEVEELIEVPLRAFLEPARQRTEVREVMGRGHEVYYYDVGPHTIWGATAHMVRELMNILVDLPAAQELRK